MIRYLVLFLSLLVFSCSKEDDPNLKQGKVAADLDEVDAFGSPSASITINDGASVTNQASISIAFSAKDAVSLRRFTVTQSSSIPSTSSSEWTDLSEGKNYSTTLSKSIGSDEGVYTFYGWSQDKAKNYSKAASASIIYDVTAPINNSISINSGASSTSNTSVSLSLTASDSTSGVSSYFVSESSSTPSNTSSGWVSINNKSSITESASYSLTAVTTVGTHQKTVYAWFKDEAGNISSVVSDSINLIVYDTTPPSAPSLSINSGSSTSTSSSVTLSISASDDIGVTGYYLSQSSSTPSSSDSVWAAVSSSTSFSESVSYTLSGGNGTNTVYVWFKDSAGNVSSKASDSIVLKDDSPTNPSISINNGSSSTTSTSVTLSLSASDDVGVNGYYISTSSSTPNSSSSGWTSVTSTTSYSDNISWTLSGSGTITLYAWFKDTAGNISSNASDSVELINIPNIYCGLLNSSTGGTSALSATKLTSGITRTTTLSSSSSNYYFFFGTSSSLTFTITWSGNARSYSVYKGAGNEHYSSLKDDDSSTVSNFDGDVIIKFQPWNSGETVTFSITESSPSHGFVGDVDYHTDKNSHCQYSVSLATNSLLATLIGTGWVYRATLSSSSSNYYAKFTSSSSNTYEIIWSGNARGYYVYKGAGNEHYSSLKDDDSSTVSNFDGDVIIKFDPWNNGEFVDFIVHLK